MKKNKRIIGSYEPIKMSEEERTKFWPNKNIMWDVHTGKGDGFFVKTQFEAEVISRLVKLEKILNKLTKQQGSA